MTDKDYEQEMHWHNVTNGNWTSQGFWNWHFLITLVYCGDKHWYNLCRCIHPCTNYDIDKFDSVQEAMDEAARMLADGEVGPIERRKATSWPMHT